MNYILQPSGIKGSYSVIRRPISTYHLYSTFSSSNSCKEAERTGLEKALRVLDLVTPKTSNEGRGNHIRLIQACMQELFETRPNRLHEQVIKTICLNSAEPTRDIFDGVLDCQVSWEWTTGIGGPNMLPRDVALLSFLEMHREGIRPDASYLSSILSSCGADRAFNLGTQIHSFAIRIGFDINVSVGSSLISLYAKCGQLNDAYLVFEKMPVRNTVSWTAIIAGFAQHCQVEMCLDLFYRMKNSTLKPNDFTFSSLLSVCMGSGSLGHGRSAHCQAIRMGYNSYLHVANALISMYAKCGGIQEADFIFEKMRGKDLISWNSMIAGYAQHGLAKQAICLLGDMEKQKIAPDAITFLGILSSCRHAGLIEESRLCFQLMLEQGIKPELDHYSCMVDLLGRSGRLEEALEFIQKMPIYPNAVIWGSLLSSCRIYGNVWIGIQAAKRRLLLEPDCAATHIQLANLYAGAGCWNQVAKVRKLMKERGLKTNPGYSWIELGNELYMFRAEDRSNTKASEILAVVDSLVRHMRSRGYVPMISLGLLEEGFSYN